MRLNSPPAPLVNAPQPALPPLHIASLQQPGSVRLWRERRRRRGRPLDRRLRPRRELEPPGIEKIFNIEKKFKYCIREDKN